MRLLLWNESIELSGNKSFTLSSRFFGLLGFEVLNFVYVSSALKVSGKLWNYVGIFQGEIYDTWIVLNSCENQLVL